MIPTLIVEDEFLVRLGLKTAINWESEGFDIVGEASNGEEGMALYLKHRPLLVLTDIKMPKKDGISLMREIRLVDPGVKFIVLTAYNEFTYAKNSIDVGVEAYLLKGSILNQELTDALLKIRTQFTTDTSSLPVYGGNRTSGFHLEPAQAKKLLFQDLPLPETLTQGVVRLCCVRIRGNRNRALQHSLAILGQKILTERQVAFLHLQHEEYLYFLFSDQPAPQVWMQFLIDAAQRYLGQVLYCGISTGAILQDNLYPFVIQAQNACNLNILKQEVCTIQDYLLPGYTRSKKAGAELISLESALLDSNPGQCSVLLQEIREEILQSGSIKFFFRTLYRLTMILAQYDETLLESEIYDFLLAIDQLDLIFTELDRLFCDMCQNLSELLPQSSLHVEKAQLYIHRNIEKNIKLRDVSAHIHLSPNYLGRLFFNETGMYLTDYILNKRILLSCKLLKEKSFSISEVACRVGVADQQYFSKIFKKKIGISPKEYAQKYSANSKPR